MCEKLRTSIALAVVAVFTMAFSTSSEGASVKPERLRYRSELALVFEVKANATQASIARVKISCDGMFAGRKTTNHNGLALFTLRKKPRSGILDGSVLCRIYKRGYEPVIKTVSLDRGRRYRIVMVDLYRRSNVLLERSQF